jgi:D-3-phosphoglycerate dehydrogenase
VAALKAGTIAAAVLDGFQVEPLALVSPLGTTDNVLLARQITNSSPAVRERVHFNTIRNFSFGLGMENVVMGVAKHAE